MEGKGGVAQLEVNAARQASRDAALRAIREYLASLFGAPFVPFYHVANFPNSLSLIDECLFSARR